MASERWAIARFSAFFLLWMGLRIILNFMKYLLVVAHPDDETLGAGASMWKWSHHGDTVDVCIMCTEAKARAFRPSDEELGDDTNESNRFLGVNKIYEGSFPNIEMNTVPHLKQVQFI